MPPPFQDQQCCKDVRLVCNRIVKVSGSFLLLLWQQAALSKNLSCLFLCRPLQQWSLKKHNKPTFLFSSCISSIVGQFSDVILLLWNEYCGNPWQNTKAQHKIVKQRIHKLEAVCNKGETAKRALEKAIWTKPQFVMEKYELGPTKCKRYNRFMIYQSKKLLH